MAKFRSVLSTGRAQEGVTAIEFAVVAPVLLLLVFGIIEFSMIMMVQNIMESATSVSSRLGKTGFVASGKSRQQTITDAITERAGSLIKANQLTITSKFYKQFDQINDPEPYVDANSNAAYDLGESYTDINGNGQWDADMGASGFGSTGDIVVYTISYPWHIATPIMDQFIGTDGIFTVTTHAVVKNEPY